MGAGQGDVGRLSAADGGGPGRAGRAGRRLLGGPDRSRSGRGPTLEAALEAEGYPLEPVRPARRRRRHGHARASSTRTPTCCSRGSREGELVLRQRGAGYLEILAAGGGILSTVAATRAATADELLAHGRRWLDEMLGHGVDDDRGEVRLRPRPRRPSSACSRSPTGSAREGPIDVVPTCLGAHAVPPEFRARPDGDRGLRPVGSSRSSCPGVAAQGRARFCDVFCEDGRVQRGPVAADPRGGRGATGCGRGSTPTSSRRPAARSSPPSSGRLSADHLATPSEAGHRRAGRGGRGRPPGRRDAPARRRPGS